MPDKKQDEIGGETKPHEKEFVLHSGRTAVVTTMEEFALPNDIAAFGFPPSRVSFQGILMTNPGHVDPGYKGPLHFTVINMGSKDYVFRRRDPIVTILLFRLDHASGADWTSRGNAAGGH